MNTTSDGAMTVGQRIRNAREQKHMSQRKLADAAGMSQPSLSDIEAGHTKHPNAAHLLKIAAALEVDPLWLLTGEGSPEKPPTATDAEMMDVFSQLDENAKRAILAAAKAIKPR
jgi:transcriptional regulator with XRE-family HTH domain